MKTILALSTVLASTLVASANPAAQPAPTPPPPPEARYGIQRVCDPGGEIVFEIDHATLPGVSDKAFPTSEAKLYSNATWSIVERTSGKITRQETGCIDSRIWGAVDKMIAAAPWHQTINDVACAAISATHVVYSARGKELFDEQICPTASLDAVSRAHLQDATILLDALTAMPEHMRGRGKP